MIKHLFIKNYALIESLSIDFSGKLNVVTGETGAGKSIMVDAIGLLLGKRIDSRSLLNKNEKCIVESVFDIKNLSIAHLFEENDIDYEDECIIRREASPTGKSRAFINDTPIKLEVLKTIGERLIDIHSQQESYAFNDPIYQLKIIDHFAKSQSLLSKYQAVYDKYCEVLKKYNELKTKNNQDNKDEDYKNFVLDELKQINFDEIDYQKIKRNVAIKENNQTIIQDLNQIIQKFENPSTSIIDSLKQVLFLLKSINKLLNNELNNIQNRTESSLIELNDIYEELKKTDHFTEIDENETEESIKKLDFINYLLNKHKFRDLGELIALKKALEDELSIKENMEEKLSSLEKEKIQLLKELEKKGEQLSKNRQLASVEFRRKILKKIEKIGIKKASIEIKLHPIAPSPQGMDKVVILFSANKGIPLQNIEKIASGGEISRVLFIIKSIVAEKTSLPTLLFDEIDTGISGEVAIQIMQMMQKIATHYQIINISHLPQIAAGANKHFCVYKDSNGIQTRSVIKELNTEERVHEIAKMIGGEKYSKAASESAKELLQIK